MTVVVPRLAREDAQLLIEDRRRLPLAEIADMMPDTVPVVTFPPVGGTRIGDEELAELRGALIALATDAGYPNRQTATSVFEGRAAVLLHERLQVTPHEAGHEDVWSYLTCCWLFDVAVWRFGPEADAGRFYGHLNRNTFRRMWWRREILGSDIDLARLGEDELVNIMERPTLASDRRLARALASEFLRRVDAGEVEDRMRLMREATKRLLRLTPFVEFAALDPSDVIAVVGDSFQAAADGLAGRPASMPTRTRTSAPPASVGVTGIATLSIVPDDADATPQTRKHLSESFDEVAQAALDIARRTGRVTNISLREVAPITSDEAREVFKALMERGELVRRGVKRGTHYVLPEPDTESSEPDVKVGPSGPTGGPSESSAPQRSVPPPAPPPRRHAQRPSESALRRLLRRPK